MLESLKSAIPPLDVRTIVIPYYPNSGNGYTIYEEDVMDFLKDRFGKVQKSNTQVSAYAILGEFEFNDLNYIRVLLDGGCNSLQVVFGEGISSQQRRENLKTLLETHKAFELYQVPERPENHKIMFGDKIFYEDRHSRESSPKNFMVFENMPEKHISEFKSEFADLKRDAARITPNNINHVKVRV
jgi:hypothetical protein